MATAIAPLPEAPAVAPETLTADESALLATPTPVPADDAARSIADASKALREQAATPADPAGDSTVVDSRPRNADGTFAPKDPADAAPEAKAEDKPADDAPVVEPDAKVFVLKGDTQRGESDIELDVAGLPAEVLERLEQNEKRGMKRKEYDASMQRVSKLQADLDAVETEIAVDTTGFVLNHVAPAKRGELATALLVEHFDELRPLIQKYWEDDATRLRDLSDLKSGIQSRRADVVNTVQASRAAAAVKSAVAVMVPETADEATAADFYNTSIALLQRKLAEGQSVGPEDVSKILAAHHRRFFPADAPASPTPPARPKLAVKPSPKPAADTAPTVVMSQDAVTAQAKARAAALATAKAGAGAGAVQRPGPPANATIEEASKYLRDSR